MYTAFYELKQEPFHVTPDPEFLFPSPSHKEALAAIIYGIEQRKGFVAITGEVGVGKTTILRSYLDFADRKDLKLVYIYNSALTFDELVSTLLQELGIEDRPPSTYQAVTRLHEELIEIYRRNQTVVLIIDEAQNMPVETLESLRMLSNLETVTEKLIQIMLIGQPEFDEMLQQHRLRQLRQRIAIHARIGALNLEDSIAYLEHRISKVALGTKPVFTKNALRLLAEASQGIPRNLNILSDNALITGFGYQVRPVNTKIVKEVLSDRRVDPAEDRPARRPIRWIGAGAAAAAAAAAAVFFMVRANAPDPVDVQMAQPNAPAPAAEVAEQPKTFDQAMTRFGQWVDGTLPSGSRPGPEPRDEPRPAPQASTQTQGSVERADAVPPPPPPPPVPAPPAASSRAREPAAAAIESRPLAAPDPSPVLNPPPPAQATPAPKAPEPSPPALQPPRQTETARAEAAPRPSASQTTAPESTASAAALVPQPLAEPERPARSRTGETQARSGAADNAARAGATAPQPTVTARRTPPIPLTAPPSQATRPAARPTPSIAAPTNPPPRPPAVYSMAVPSVVPQSASGSGAAPSSGGVEIAARGTAAVASAARSEQLVRTVRFGDSLWTMAEDVYGYVNPNVLRRVQDANPHIRNINLLAPGQDVVFPRVPEAPSDSGLALYGGVPPTGGN